MARILVSAAEDLLVRLLLQEVVGDRMGGSLPRPFQPACSASFHQNASANGGGWYWAQRSEKKKEKATSSFSFEPIKSANLKEDDERDALQQEGASTGKANVQQTHRLTKSGCRIVHAQTQTKKELHDASFEFLDVLMQLAL